MKNLVLVLNELKDLKIDIFSYKQAIDTSTAMGSMFFQFLGGSVAAAAVNLTQTFTTTLPYLSKDEFGGAKKAASEITKAMRDAKLLADNEEIRLPSEAEWLAALRGPGGTPLPWGDDCDDAQATTYPGASDTWYDGIDSDCNGNDDNDVKSNDGYDHRRQLW
mgnify:CR=1 FL=1